jgi:hypothetical protein
MMHASTMHRLTSAVPDPFCRCIPMERVLGHVKDVGVRGWICSSQQQLANNTDGSQHSAAV